MLLSQKTTIKLNNAESNIIGHMCYAAYIPVRQVHWLQMSAGDMRKSRIVWSVDYT